LKNDTLKVGYLSPGWPLSHFPNGVVAYVQNISSIESNDIKSVILAGSVIGQEFNRDVVDLSKFIQNKNFLSKLASKVTEKANFNNLDALQYQRYLSEQTHRITQAIHKIKPALDVLEMEESFGVASAFVRTCKTPVITRLHGPWLIVGAILGQNKTTAFKLKTFHEGEAIKQSHGITSPSFDALEKVREFYNVALPNAKVIPNPVLKVKEDNLWHYRPNNLPFILFVGRFDLVKGGDLILNAFRIIALKNPDISLIFVGPDRGLVIDGYSITFDEYLNKYIPESHVKKRIKQLGHCGTTQITELRQSSLVTVISSRYETFSISLAEALAAGCPTVSTRVGGIKELITDGFNGLLAEPESPESIAEKVIELIGNPAKMQFLSKNAIDDCERRFSPNLVIKQTVDFYKSVLSNI
jgi:glycosyltransferase involved in cell wall biosynthesis